MVRKSIQPVLMILVVALLVGVAVPDPAASKGIEWYGYQEGKALGKEEGKKVLLFFWAEWCRYCEQMQKETFTAPQVIDFLKRHFIAVKIDSDKEKSLASQYAVRGLPTTWFLEDSGRKIASRPGFIPPEAFLSILKYMQTESYNRMSYGDFIKK